MPPIPGRLCSGSVSLVAKLGRPARQAAGIVFVSLLWLPTLQGYTGLVQTEKLGGVEEPAEAVALSWTTWSDGSWQASYEHRFDHRLGLRDWMVRLDNEARLRAFGVAKRPVLRGPGDWLVEEGYLPSTALVRLRGEAARLLATCAQLRVLQEVLASRGIALTVLISPNKVFTVPERLPAAQAMALAALAGRPKQYDVFLRGLRATGVRVVDCVAFARHLVATEPPAMPPMFVASGIHWTNYGAARCAIHLLDELERTAGLDVRNLAVAAIDPGAPDGGEMDMAHLANVVDTTRWRTPLGQPVVALRPGDQGRTVAMLMVGTSFLWGLTSTLKLHAVADPLSVYYYDRTRTDFVGGDSRPPISLERTADEVLRELPRYDVVVIEASEGALLDLGNGFIERVLRAFDVEPDSTLGLFGYGEVPPLPSVLEGLLDWGDLR
ncbi:MAG: hypothetical protein R3F56_02415 [Planctomycetota bacterium]